MDAKFAPTIIIRHPNENPQKCSILPLKGRPDVRVLLHPVKHLPPLDGYVLLSADGPPLTESDRDCGLLLLDCCWRRAAPMRRGVEHLPTRSLQGYRTAYPRVSRYGTDPDNGLASV